MQLKIVALKKIRGFELEYKWIKINLFIMKKIAVIFFLLFINFVNGQKTVDQLNNTIIKSSSNKKIELRNFNEANQIQMVKNLTVYGLIIPKDIKKTTVLKYDEQIKGLPNIASNGYKALFPNINIKEARVLPEYYLNFLENSKGGYKPLIFTPMIVSSAPLTNKNGIKGYRTKITLALFSENKWQKQVKTSVRLEVVSDQLTVKPNKIILKHLNLPTTDIELYTDNELIKDSVGIRILTDSNLRNGYTHYLKVTPSLTLTTSKKEIQGFGVQKAKVIVRFNGSSSKTKENIIVRSSSGEVKPSSFTLAYNEAKIINVRSEGIDDIKLTASTSSSQQVMADSNTIIIKQTFPYLFLIASLIGGVLGMIIKLGFKKNKKISPKLFLASVLIGFLGAIVYYVLGINFLRIEVPSTFNEFAVLGFSALCSLILKPNVLSKG